MRGRRGAGVSSRQAAGGLKVLAWCYSQPTQLCRLTAAVMWLQRAQASAANRQDGQGSYKGRPALIAAALNK